ncbi:hypothetical protein AXE80_09405 [Wenyingzhuangia fucanilytica]|uniref:Lipoprotein n=1 Tax=Wenyingzhuangia fucanilytica TaxID=1790137 RepID=A0A1B1Y6S6_9FLAO|nr:hypothetical protein [Wenyingzhuangia fucanilytica]ANW96482.1 hypothetical protein AXE80_09405 [Wenyingzhuangia fucanilytica]
MIKKLLLLLLFISSIISCSGLKSTQKFLAQGNYDQAIDQSLNYLQKNRYGKKAPEFHQLLFESYNKAVEKDKRTLAYLTQDSNPESLEQKFNVLLKLEQRQNKIRPLLPINGFNFKTENYTSETLSTRNKLSEYLYKKANDKLASKNKQFIREAHDDFNYLQEINPNYKNVPSLIDVSRAKGMGYVIISFHNNTSQIIPQKLADNLLNLEQYNLDNYWTTYQTYVDNNIHYDFELKLIYDEIIISPERVKESIFTKQKEIVQGKEYVLDKNGNVQKDSKGNDIKRDKKVKITSKFHQFSQTKTCEIKARASISKIDNNQVLFSMPISSLFIFDHYFATQSGDKRALDDHFIDMLANREIPFPSNEQMITDTGNDVKCQLQEALVKYNF